MPWLATKKCTVCLQRHEFCLDGMPVNRPQWFRFTCPIDHTPGVVSFPSDASWDREERRCPPGSVKTGEIPYDC